LRHEIDDDGKLSSLLIGCKVFWISLQHFSSPVAEAGIKSPAKRGKKYQLIQWLENRTVFCLTALLAFWLECNS
jgi:hypothetical protein